MYMREFRKLCLGPDKTPAQKILEKVLSINLGLISRFRKSPTKW